MKHQFLKFINNNNINDFITFIDNLMELTIEQKGIYFEYFCLLYFMILLIDKTDFIEFYLYKDIPSLIKKMLYLPSKDKGIDAIAIDKYDNVYAIQCKFRSEYNKKLSFTELSTFSALTFGSDVKINYGVIFSNCIDVCDEFKNDKYNNILYDELNKRCDELFWKNVREYIGEKEITLYEILKPLDHQKSIISECITYYEKENIGKLFMACGSGKTFLSYWLSVRELKYDKIFIVVPSLYLLSQVYDVYKKETQYDEIQYHFILIGSDMDDKKDNLFKHTTNKSNIEKELKENNKIILITTYHSSNILVEICKENKYMFDFGIYDEAHRTVGIIDKRFTNLVTSNIEYKKLFITATEKIYNYDRHNTEDSIENIISMDNEIIYGKTIYKYSMRKAIENNVLVDYKIIAPFLSSEKFKEMDEYKYVDVKKFNIKTILIGIMIILSIEKYKIKHLLIFSNTNEKAKNISDFINEYLSLKKYELRCIFLSGNDNMTKRKKHIIQFEKDEIGIISSARIFGEGVDIKKCDAICFADNKSSSIDIVQYLGRCLRKCPEISDKFSHVIVPFILDDLTDFFNYSNSSYIKLRKILKTIGTTDDIITEKFTLFNCNNIINNKKEIEDDTEYKKYDKDIELIDIDEFKNNLLSKVFDKSGIIIDEIRNMIILENMTRYINNEKLIITKNKIYKFLKNKDIHDIYNKINIKNIIKYALGEKLFYEIQKKYYYTKEEIIKACINLNIYDYKTYKIFHIKDAKLPSYKFIDNGFYNDIDEKFNIDILMGLQYATKKYF